MKFIAPSIDLTAFNCPHCGVLTSQGWFTVLGERHSRKQPLPHHMTPEKLEKVDFKKIDEEIRDTLKTIWTRRSKGQLYLHKTEKANYGDFIMENCHFSQCDDCGKPTIWLFGSILYPNSGEVEPPNPDFSEDINRDYVEAASIVHQSPRGAAALLRLCVQKLCVEIGNADPEITMKDDNINTNIGILVEHGLSVHIQKALDTVRVIGNESVHPGEMDIKDDSQTAQAMFRLINMIADKMLSEPKRIDEMYLTLPEGKRNGIDQRDKKSNGD